VLVTTESALTVKRIFELANRAHFLYFTRNQADRGQSLKSVLLNCGRDGASLWPVYRKPFDVIFERAKTRMVGAVGFENTGERIFNSLAGPG